MMFSDRILVLGYFGYDTNQIDGQTVKTRNVYTLLNNHDLDVDYFDTQVFKRDKFQFFILLTKIFKAKKIVYLPAHNNLKFIFPLLYPLCFLMKKKIFYFVIGGWLCDFLKNKPFHKFFLKGIKGIFVETTLLKNELILKGFKNVEIIPNFKFYKQATQSVVDNHKLVFISRINRKKGLSVLFNMIDQFGEQNNIKIDFYGPIYENDKKYFYEEIEKRDRASYMGVLDPDSVIDTLSHYSFMVFPTEYYTEGMPGVIIDAYFANLPIVATNWLYANEFIEDGKTGLISKWGDEDDFIEKVIFLINNPFKLEQFKSEINKKKYLYTDKYAWEVINKFVIR
ncbi:glycosyltransferase family 4 protein [Sphingobacterium yanglingense]|uniref:Glycosyltransferase involved in cell wall biosynthesis n=1 Tax=Sphingobacterium yanglingense TaxID=1437280 RepID=A0A4R6W8B1_9SPHI|nr:glycosyltransferase family 4 protein [Sphingobacterium yanglingense]TDQ73502.1 glycosyltransferase involved in cell wall biosynthesis [Sphingobacterium yanglingense]